MTKSVVVETIETLAHRLLIKGDGIIRVYSKPSHIDLEDCQALMAKYNELRSGGDRLVILMDPTEENSISPAAKKFIMTRMKEEVGVLALIARKKFTRTMFNVMRSAVSTGVDLKMFDNETDAENWLLENHLS